MGVVSNDSIADDVGVPSYLAGCVNPKWPRCDGLNWLHCLGCGLSAWARLAGVSNAFDLVQGGSARRRRSGRVA